MDKVIDTSFKHYYSRSNALSPYEVYNDDWSLTPQGDMMNVIGRYEINHNELSNSGWLLHLSDKRWFDANTFIPAYFAACDRAGISIVNIRVRY